MSNDENVLSIEGSLFEREFFGVKRHNLISGTAERLLQSQTAKDKVRGLLDPLLQTMADVGGWADDIKEGTPPDDEFTSRFLADPRNSGHRNWHFVNIPLGATGYDRVKYARFTSDTDVVQIARESVRVLKGESTRFEEINALRLISHLIGDIHQPIHVGCGYVDRSPAIPILVFDPDVIAEKNLRHDKGGNDILLPIGSSTNLHSYWDSRLGGNVTDLIGEGGENDENSPKGMAIAKMLDLVSAARLADVQSDAPATEAKPVEDRVVEWASDSVRQARIAYQSLVITEKSGNKFKVSWDGREQYDGRCEPIVIEQMVKAARNLASLLDEIWKDPS
jgi:hypothetical protein